MVKWTSRFGTDGFAALRKLDGLAPLGRADIDALSEVLTHARPVRARYEIVSEGEEIHSPVILVSGWACHERVLSDGRRQLVSVLLPGDMIGLLRRPRPRSLSSALTCTEATIAEASELQEAINDPRHGGLALACMRAEALEQLCMLDHIVRLGRQTAYERLAEFFLEMRTRLRLVEHFDGEEYDMPLTQESLADLLGLSSVHINRTLQQMRRERLIDFRSGSFVLHDVQALARQVRYVDPIQRSSDFLVAGSPIASVRPPHQIGSTPARPWPGLL